MGILLPLPQPKVFCLTIIPALHPCLIITKGYGPFPTPAPAVVTRTKRKQVKMAVCSLCIFTSLSFLIHWRKFCFSSVQIALLPVSGAMKHVRVKDVRSMVSQTRVLTGCVKPGRSGSSAVLTNVRANCQPLRRLRTQVSSGLPGTVLFLIFPCRVPS
jgi:hypothetical protein